MKQLLIGVLVPVFLTTIGFMRLAPGSAALASEVKLTMTNVNAPPEKVFALIEDFHKWGMWSAHEKRDSAVRRTYTGPEKGKGAIYEWDGDEKIGAGRARIDG
jgi:hypothetical protein